MTTADQGTPLPRAPASESTDAVAPAPAEPASPFGASAANARADAIVVSSAGVISRFWKRADAWMAVASEYLSPILVKEARQALKSKQFIITFSLLLICGWAWSFLGVAIMGPDIHFSNYS